MKNKQLTLSLLTVAMALGTAWAVRGKFGHEQGAAWAGAIGAVSVVILSRRNDWHEKIFRISMAAAFGWGISGVMSYGKIVGYGRATDFINVGYGLMMLFVIGLLYGFLGGGFFGLALLETKSIKIKWHTLIAEMVAFGLLTYAILVEQLGWLMTPPRSEMWAACLGACIALAWYLVRHGYEVVLKVALWSAIGAGFGFAFGNFLQVVGSISALPFNFWNVMEYSIGFFGGMGMAYGTFTSEWPVPDDVSATGSSVIPLLFLMCFIPFVVWNQSFVTERFDFILSGGGTVTTIFIMRLLAIGAIIASAVIVIRRNYAIATQPSIAANRKEIKLFFILYLGVYIFLSFLVTGLYTHPLEQYGYIINLLIILFLFGRLHPTFKTTVHSPFLPLASALLVILFLAFLSLIAINTHGDLPGSQIRF